VNVVGRFDARGDLTALAGGIALTTVVVLSATRYDDVSVGLSAVVALSLFVAATVCFLTVPHVAVAVTIPLFVSIPAIKIFAGYWIGPVKDAVTVSAGLATVLYVLQREGRQTVGRTDKLILAAVGGFVALYVLNVGGVTGEAWHGEGWLHGVRLMSEPLILLLAGLLLPGPRRTLSWAATSLVATGCAVAAYGLFQQVAGPGWLLDVGYSFNQHVDMLHELLRSFGTLDDAFAYAFVLFLALVTTVFWMRRRALAWACGLLIAAGIAVSFVQTAVVVASALLALWLIRSGRTAAGVMIFAAALVSGVVLAVAAAPTAVESKTVQAGPSTYLTLNGRTTVWATIFDDHTKIPLGQGVGTVGRASLRAQIGITDVSGSAGHSRRGQIAVDSGYFAAVADVGVVGLAILLLLYGRIFVLARQATRLPGDVAGWLCLGYLTVVMLDALTRDSFTGFPTAYLAFLLIGLALAVGREERDAARAAAPAS
jgi:hypothetical protein